jgi:mannan endo-1,4-beta-mannosidase
VTPALAVLAAAAAAAAGCGGRGGAEAPAPAPLPDRAARFADRLAAPVESSGCPPLPPISGFVGRDDGALLYDLFAPYRATGTNLYYLQQLLSYAQLDQDAGALAAVYEVLDDLVCLSLPVARIWGFNDLPQDSSSIRHDPWSGFREEGLRGLDQAVFEAKRRGIRVIIPLVNNWGEYGGLPAYAAWASRLSRGPVAHDDFFVSPLMKQWWKDYAYMLANRVNSFTGIAYKDEPAILAWEIGNELRCQGCRGSSKLPDTVRELAAFLRPIVPHQLISDGGDGFDDNPPAYLGLSNLYAVRGDEGASFTKMAAIDELDMLSYHFYPHNYGLTTARDAQIWIERHQAIGAASGKVAYLGECGFVAPDTERAQSYDQWLRQLFQTSGAPLGLFWQLSPAGRLNNDGYAVYSRRDDATAWILARWGKALQ